MGLIDSLIGTVGSIFNNQQNISAAQQANQENIALQRENRDFQANMANTAHRREVADLKAAGLNPVLSAGGGSGAATPSSAAAQVEPVKSADIAGQVSQQLTEGMHRTLMESQIKKEMANAISAGSEAAVSAQKAKNEVEGQEAKNAFTRTQTAVAKALMPAKKESLETNSEWGSIPKAFRSIMNRTGVSSAYEAATSGDWGAKLYDMTHGGGNQ